MIEKYKEFYPRGVNPIHEVNDWCHVRRLMRAAINGVKVNPILVDGENLLAGTHRMAANNLLSMLDIDAKIRVWDISDVELSDDLQAAIDDLDFSRIDELWDRCHDHKFSNH